MGILITLPFLLQALVIMVDEIYFHQKRGLPLWERLGHPIDTLSVLACIGYVLLNPFNSENLFTFSLLAILSCILVTKDEFVHKHHCPASEHWLHALLFILHPITLFLLGLIWPVISGNLAPDWLSKLIDQPIALTVFLYLEALLMSLFCLYQIIYWNILWKPKSLIKE